MISEEERKAIKQCKKCISNRCEKCKHNDNAEVCIAIHDTSIQTVLNLIETQNKMIELMANNLRILYAQSEPCEMETMQRKECAKYENCFECIIEYFRNKAKESE